MARRKIRKYPSTNVVKNMINEYFAENTQNVVRYLLEEVGYTNTDSLWEAENNLRFGFDCGWVYVCTKNREQYHEWVLDNGSYDAFVRGINCPYVTQSTTLKQIQIDKALRDLGLDFEYYTSVRLD